MVQIQQGARSRFVSGGLESCKVNKSKNSHREKGGGDETAQMSATGDNRATSGVRFQAGFVH